MKFEVPSRRVLVLLGSALVLVLGGVGVWAGCSHADPAGVSIANVHKVKSSFPKEFVVFDVPRATVTQQAVDQAQRDAMGMTYRPDYCAARVQRAGPDTVGRVAESVNARSADQFIIVTAEEIPAQLPARRPDGLDCSQVVIKNRDGTSGLVSSADVPHIDGVEITGSDITMFGKDGALSLQQYVYTAWLDDRHAVNVVASSNPPEEPTLARDVLVRAIDAVRQK